MSAVADRVPETRFAPDRLSLRDCRDIMERAERLIREFAFYDGFEEGNENYTGKDICADLEQAQSTLYLHEQRMKAKGVL